MTAPLPDPATTVEEREIALRQGRVAARDGNALLTCPYDANGDARQRSLATSWVRGYLATTSTDSTG
jgi:hypothetical protein